MSKWAKVTHWISYLWNVTLDMKNVILDIVLNEKGVKAQSFISNKTAFDQSTTTKTWVKAPQASKSTRIFPQRPFHHVRRHACYQAKVRESLEHPAFFRIWRHSKGIRDRLRQRQTSVRYWLKKPLQCIIADIHNPAVGILLMLIRSIENDLIAKKWSYLYFFVSFVLFVYFVSLVHPICLLCRLCLLLSYSRHGETQWDTVRHSETQWDTVRHSETQWDKT
jgi:hypothetical protein